MGDVVPFDPWDVETTDTYDPDDFYCGSTDIRGHHAGLNISIKPDVSGQIDALVASKLFPAYKTKGHFARDAMIHRLHYLAERGQMPELLRFVRIEMKNSEIEAMKYEHQRINEMIEGYETLLIMKRDRNDRRGLRTILDKALTTVEELDEPWDQMLLDVCNRYKPS